MDVDVALVRGRVPRKQGLKLIGLTKEMPEYIPSEGEFQENKD